MLIFQGVYSSAITYPRLTTSEAGFLLALRRHRPSTRNALPRRRRPGEEMGGPNGVIAKAFDILWANQYDDEIK